MVNYILMILYFKFEFVSILHVVCKLIVEPKLFELPRKIIPFDGDTHA